MKERSRTSNVSRNVFWAFFCQILTTLLSLYSRKIFLQYLGEELLGVNSLFGEVLTIFSFADLGLSTAITFSLYKPIADGDTEKVRALLAFFKKIYRFVVLGLIVIAAAYFPFLGFLKTELPLADIRLYYVLFVLTNILAYLFVFRETYVIAEQSERRLTVITFIFTVVTTATQIVLVHLTQNYFHFLLVGLGAVIVRKAFTNVYIIKKYPETLVSGVPLPDKSERAVIFRKSRSLIVHKIGNLAINQTDGLIISYMISVVKLGIVANYLMLKTVIVTLMNRVYSSILPSVGNLIYKTDEEAQRRVFYTYDLVNAWLYTFCFVALATLSTPFITLFFRRDDLSLELAAVVLLFFAFFLDGLRAPVSAFREAKGLYEKDKWFTILAAVVNLVASIVLIYLGLDLVGLYIGTILAMLVLIVSRTIMLFSDDRKRAAGYFLRLAVHIALAIGALAATQAIRMLIENAWGLHIYTFLLEIVAAGIVPNLILLVAHCRSPYFKHFLHIVKGRFLRRNTERTEKTEQ